MRTLETPRLTVVDVAPVVMGVDPRSAKRVQDPGLLVYRP
jgi:hypothetical protein